LTLATHDWSTAPPNFNASAYKCVPPGQCTPPSSKYSRVITGPTPGQQWNMNGGFCGAFSVQHAALAVGAWVSQDLVRKANRDGPGPHNMHGDRTEGYEVMPSNVAWTAAGLKLKGNEWDYSKPVPQAAAFKAWLKAHLSSGHAIAWFPMCKGDGHQGYPGSCPAGGPSGDTIGHVDHVEAMYGIFSDRPLNDTTVGDDDWIVHTSDQDYMPYYRPLNSLEDTAAMEGNCKHAGAGFGRNEMYPCFDKAVTYGLAVTGLDVEGTVYPTAITTEGSTYEPNVRGFERPKTFHARVHVSGLSPARKYTTYRFDGIDALPAGPPFASGASYSWTFGALGRTHSFDDPNGFRSDGAVYYVTTDAESAVAVEEAE